jgi:hypothetical protein
MRREPIARTAHSSPLGSSAQNAVAPSGRYAPYESKHRSSDDGSVNDYQIDSVVSEATSPEKSPGAGRSSTPGLEARIVRSVDRILARLPHVLGARLAQRVGHIEPVTKYVGA